VARLLSVNVGLPRDVTWNGQTVWTAVWKSAVSGRAMVRTLNIDGDAQGDLAGHGGEQRAVFVYQIDSYRYWERFLGRSDFVFGQFGENFTVEGLADDEVCIGDRYRIGGALFEVSQPRVTCFRVGIRMNEPRMPALLVAHRRPGFYFRVLQEGEVGAGDEIVKVADGPERLTVAEVDGLLYLPGHSTERLQTALRVPALSPGWKGSFQALLGQDAGPTARAGNSGLAEEEQAPAWPGFRAMRVARVLQESDTVTSFVLAPADGRPLPVFQAGQFVVLRLPVDPTKAPVLRSYSLSDLPSAGHLRISVKREQNGIGSAFLNDRTRPGDVLEVSAPRGRFVLRSSETPVVLLSAGIGATPVLSILHALAAERSPRETWWIHGARNAGQHPFAEEARALLKQLPRGRSFVMYSNPAATDRLGVDFDAAGRLDAPRLEKLGVSPRGDFYLCGPPSFMRVLGDGLRGWGVPAANILMEVFGALEGITPGMAPVAHTQHPPAGAAGSGPAISFARSGLTVPWDGKFRSLLELAEACDVPVRWSCRTGVCHTCMTGLVGGSVGYDLEPLERPSPGNVLVCCSQPRADTTLDL
jgi:ferredoxin-NADP reductase/MOSC domain-containing protein YiiM/ferredoxin